MKKPDKKNSEPSAPAVARKDSAGEPVARSVAVPALLFAVLGGLLFWGDMHIVGQGGELDGRVHYPYLSSNELAGLNIREPEDPLITKGREMYRVCAGCHQNDGQGLAASDYPPLAGSNWVNEKDPARIVRIVIRGLGGPIEVSGKTYSRSQMTELSALGDEEIAAVLSYVRNEWGNKAPLVKPAQVGKIRKEIESRPGAYTADELLKVPLAN